MYDPVAGDRCVYMSSGVVDLAVVLRKGRLRDDERLRAQVCSATVFESVEVRGREIKSDSAGQRMTGKLQVFVAEASSDLGRS